MQEAGHQLRLASTASKSRLVMVWCLAFSGFGEHTKTIVTSMLRTEILPSNLKCCIVVQGVVAMHVGRGGRVGLANGIEVHLGASLCCYSTLLLWLVFGTKAHFDGLQGGAELGDQIFGFKAATSAPSKSCGVRTTGSGVEGSFPSLF